MSELISIIICTYNRPGTIEKVLESLLSQRLDGSFLFEVVLVDNNPDGLTKPVAESYQNKFAGNLRYFLESVRGKSNAMNRGVKEAKGNILVFTDDDVIADVTWLSTVIDFFHQHECDGVGGRVLPIYPEETPQWVKDNAVQLAGGVVIYDYGEREFVYDRSYYPFIGANFAFRRRVFDSCGLFRTDLGPGMPVMGEDTEFIERLVKQGKKLFYCGKAVIWHPVDLKRVTLKHMIPWHIALGRFAARMEIENKEEKYIFWFGVPRYLIRKIFSDIGILVVSLFDRMKFFNACRGFFRHLGMIQEYRLLRKKESSP